MTDRDPVERAADAMRELTDGHPDLPDETLARVLGTLATHKRRRLRVTTWVLPMAAVLVGSTAWATATGRLPAAVRKVVTQIESLSWSRPASDPAAPARNVARPCGSEIEQSAVEAMPAPTESSSADASPATGDSVDQKSGEASNGETTGVEAPPVARPAPQQAQHERQPNGRRASAAIPTTVAAIHSAGNAEPPTPEPTALPAATSAEPYEPLYREAHEAHFAKNDPALALALWDRYLAAGRGGSFELEARYNRAIALLRLGRRAEAVRALEPFAAGIHGKYRQSEAATLIDAAHTADQRDP